MPTRMRRRWCCGRSSTPAALAVRRAVGAIERHSMLANGHTVALVTPDARLTWFCHPRRTPHRSSPTCSGGAAPATYGRPKRVFHIINLFHNTYYTLLNYILIIYFFPTISFSSSFSSISSILLIYLSFFLSHISLLLYSFYYFLYLFSFIQLLNYS
jgi:hypothetical protein